MFSPLSIIYRFRWEVNQPSIEPTRSDNALCIWASAKYIATPSDMLDFLKEDCLKTGTASAIPYRIAFEVSRIGIFGF